MAENKDEKVSGVTVRISEELEQELEKEKGKYRRPKPSRGKMLERAWRVYKDVTATKAEPSPAGEASCELAKLLAGLSPEHQQKIRDLINLYLTGDENVIHAVDSNLAVFSDPRLKLPLPGKKSTS